MKEEIALSTIYDLELIRAFASFSRFKGKNYTLRKNCNTVIRIVLFTIWVCFLILGFIYNVWEEMDGGQIGLFFSAVVILLLIERMYMYMVIQSNRKILYTSNYIIFGEDGILWYSHCLSSSGKANIKYEGIHRLYECKGRMYLYVNKNQVYLFDINQVDSDTMDQLKDLLHRKLQNEKYVICKA